MKSILKAFLLTLVLLTVLFLPSCGVDENCPHDLLNNECENCAAKASEGLAFEYNSENDSYYVVGLGECEDEVVLLPDTYREKPVTFIKGFQEDSQVKKLYLPETVTSVGAELFKGATALEEVYMQGVKKLAGEAFARCTALKKVYIPTALSTIDRYALSDTPSLCEVVFEKGREELFCVLDSAFRNSGIYDRIELYDGGGLYLDEFLLYVDPAVEEFTVRDGTKNMAQWALKDCARLTSLKIEKNVKFHEVFGIYTSTFFYCDALKRVEASSDVCFGEWPSNLEEIILHGEVKRFSSFQNCMNLKKVLLPAGMEEIPANLFMGCKSLKEVSIPSGVKKIGAHAFAGCQSLETVQLPSGILQIMSAAFDQCVRLKTVTLPSTVKTLGAGAFGNTAIESLILPGGIQEIGAKVGEGIKAFYLKGDRIPDGFHAEWKGSAEVYLAGEWTTVEGKPLPNA